MTVTTMSDAFVSFHQAFYFSVDRSTMERRQFLRGIGVAGIATICGCNSLSSEPVSLGSPTVGHPDEGDYYYNFAHEGDGVGNVDITIESRSTPNERAGIGLSVGPQPEFENSMFRVTLRAPADSQPGEQSARFLLEVADSASYPLSVRVTDQDGRVLELEGLAEAGYGNATIPFRLEVVPQTAAESLSLRSTARWRGPEGALFEATFTDRLSMPVTQ
jgi:hypothetical protein